MYKLSIISIILLFAACQTDQPVTFTTDIAPIIHQNCTPCHRPKSSGPFSLITYQDVVKKAKTIAQVTQDRYMPPWPADRNYTSFINERGLSENEIQLIQDWVVHGMPLGDSINIPLPPVYSEGSQLGEPDLVLKMPQPYRIEGDNKDRFIVVKIPFELPADTFIKAIEFVPGNKKIVHHMNAHLINYEPGKKTSLDSGTYIIEDNHFDNLSTIEQLDLSNDDGSYPMLVPSISNYLPGVTPLLYPDGVGGYKMAQKGLILVKNLHYGPTPVTAYDQSYFNIFFMDKKPERPIKEFQMGTSGVSPVVPELALEPNAKQSFTTQFTVPTDISILTINPHMHLLGTSFWAYGIQPNGDTIRLIKIPKWDFRWQYYYTFPTMLKIPKGTTLYAHGTYDNTAGNPNNPFSPPRKINTPEGYMKTTDEMFQLIVTYLPYQPGDEYLELE